MVLFNIDKEKCDKDGICATECPAQIIEMTKEGPAPIEGASEICIQCGHCVAVCPKGAFALNAFSHNECLTLKKDLALDGNQAEHFIRSRRSIRRYKDKSVPNDLFESALNTACHASSGHNQQPVRWLVMNKKNDVTKIGTHVVNWMRYILKTHPKTDQMIYLDKLVNQWDQGIDRICRNAPQLVFAHASDERISASADCHIALSYLELVLPSFGLGSCWAGFVSNAVKQWPDLAKELHLPKNHTCHGVIMMGYPKNKYYRAPKRNSPKVKYHT